MLIIIFCVLVGLGMLDSVYLIYKNRPNQVLSCPLNTKCNAVLKSKWNKFLGVRNEIWGILYYLTLLFLMVMYLYNVIGSEIIVITVSFGVIYSAFLTYIQIYRLKEYCVFCLFSAMINILLYFTILSIYL